MPNTAVLRPPPPIVYPDSDGKPIAENTKQLHWIVVLFGNISALFRERPDVFVAADLLWYPVEGHPEIRIAPDVLVVFGRPKGHRGSYQQWQEGGAPITVVFDVLSPGNSASEMIDKFALYEDYGVEEYYIYDPDTYRFYVYLRRGEALLLHRQTRGFVSPRLGIRFEPREGADLQVYYPDGRRFLTFEEMEAANRLAQDLAQQAQQQAQVAQQQARQATERARRLAILSRKARLQQASPEELAELERLEGEQLG
jgi:Uma2 family endonuclease